MKVPILRASVKLKFLVDFLGLSQTLTKPEFGEGRPDHTDVLINRLSPPFIQPNPGFSDHPGKSNFLAVVSYFRWFRKPCKFRLPQP